MNPRNLALKQHSVTVARILLFASYTFLLVGMAALGYAAYVLAAAKKYQAFEIRALEGTEAPSEPDVARSVPAEGSIIGEIRIPRLGLRAVIAQGDLPAILRHAVGHIPGTALPGEIGNVALAGHRDSFFRPLRAIAAGDIISLRTPARNFQYRVESTAIVSPTDLGVLRPSRERELTLITCFPFSYIGHAPNRFVVHAREID